MATEPASVIGTYLRMAREKADLSQKDVAKLLNYKGMNFVSMIENGASKVPLSKIAEFVNVYQLPPFFGFAIIREIYSEVWTTIIGLEKINPQFGDMTYKELDKKVGALYKAELKKAGIETL